MIHQWYFYCLHIIHQSPRVIMALMYQPAEHLGRYTCIAIVYCKLYSVLCKLYSVMCNLYSVLCKLSSVLGKLYSVLWKLYSYCASYTLYCVSYVVHCATQIVYWARQCNKCQLSAIEYCSNMWACWQKYNWKSRTRETLTLSTCLGDIVVLKKTKQSIWFWFWTPPCF